RGALYSPAGNRLLGVRRCATPGCATLPGAGVDAIRARLLESIDGLAAELCGGRPAGPVVVGFAGPVDGHGTVLAAPTVWGGDASAFPLGGALQARWPQARVRVVNDVTAAGYRYLRGPGDDLVVVTVSSGIGHKVFVDGRPVVGRAGRGGEIGHLRMCDAADAPLCECGGRGHLGALGSGRATPWQVRRLAREDPVGFFDSALCAPSAGDPRRVDNPMLIAAFREGDDWAARVVERMARPLGQALAAIHQAVGSERFVLVGGFALALGPAYASRVARSAADACWCLGMDWDSAVELGEPDDDAGLIGGGRLAAILDAGDGR
ncbi:MAG TPA: ROK family protein, partial [Longimicrobiaceae bacterium]|nr:ROK family protein [Longimicrobiaceae bacterium]